MKKLLALTLAMMMCLSCTAVMAEELPVQEFTVEAPEGETVAIGTIGLTMIVPTTFQKVELTDDYKAQGIIDGYVAADQSSSFFVGLYDITETWEADTLATLQADATYSDICYASINENVWLSYVDAANSLIFFAIDLGNGQMMQFTCTPVTDTDVFMPLMLQILGSLAVAE